MKLRMLSLLLAFSMLLAVPAFSATVDYTTEDTLITITGTTDAGVAGEEVTLVILKSKKTLDDLKQSTSETVKSVVQYIGQTTSGVGGAFTFLIPVDSHFDSGLIVANVGGRGFTKQVNLDIIYTSIEYIRTILAAFETAKNTSGTTAMKQFVNDYKEILGFPMAEYESNQEAVCVYLKSIALSGEKNGIKEIYAGFLGGLLKEQISKADSAGKITLALDSYDKSNAFDRTDYNKLLLKGGGADIVKAVAGKSFASPEDSLKGLNLAVFLGSSNKASAKEELQQLFEKYNEDYIGISAGVGSRYGKADKAVLFKNVSKHLQKTPVYTKEAYISAFNKALDDTEKETTVTPPSNGGSPSGGGGKVEIPAPTNTPKPTDPPKQEGSFDDLDSVAWAKDSVETLVKKNIISKDESGKFRPNDNITREEYVKMLVTALGILEQHAVSDFTDADKNAWYAPYLASAVNKGLVSGISDTEFGVGRPITREDIAVLTYRAAQIMGVDLAQGDSKEFADSGNISSYAQQAVEAMSKAGIINGYEDGSFGAKNAATRAEVAVMLDRFLKK